jgi:hypothetical protein
MTDYDGTDEVPTPAAQLEIELNKIEQPVGNSSEDHREKAVSANISTIFRITGSAAEIDGFVRSFEFLDNGPAIIDIRYHANTPARIDETYPTDQISLDLHFDAALTVDSTCDLVMEQFRNSQRERTVMKIEQVDDRAGTAELDHPGRWRGFAERRDELGYRLGDRGRGAAGQVMARV